MNVERGSAQRQETPTLNGSLRRTIHAVLFRGDRYFVADCLEIPVVTQGLAVDETLSNLREAVALHLEDEDLEEIGLIRNPTISVTMEANVDAYGYTENKSLERGMN